jgi:AP2-like factor, euAP2 lineage
MIFCRAYDQANIMFWGVSADINFTLDDYKDDIKVITDQITTSAIMNRSEQVATLFICMVLIFFYCLIKTTLFAMHSQMNNFIKEEFVQVLRRQGAGFVRGRSKVPGSQPTQVRHLGSQQYRPTHGPKVRKATSIHL